MKRFFLATLFALSLASAADAQAPITKREMAEKVLMTALMCMTALERGVGLGELEDWKNVGLDPASPEQRKRDPRVKDDTTPVWAPPVGPLLVSEPPGRCDILADQLPAADLMTMTVNVARKKYPDFTETPVRLERLPIARQIVREANGARYVIDLKGAEANTPGLNNKASIFSASVIKETIAPRAAAGNPARRQIVLAALNQNPINRYLRVWPSIPADDLPNILKKSEGLTTDREVLGVIDTSISKNGSVGLYFYADGMVSVKPVTGSSYIAYDAIRGIKPDKGMFTVHYGQAELQTGPNKDEVVAIVDAILAGTQPK